MTTTTTWNWFHDATVEEPTLRLTNSVNGDPLQAFTWDDFKGQFKVKRELQMHINSALRRNTPLGHVLLAAPPGLGKTTLAHIIANSLGVRLTSISPQEHEYTIFETLFRASDRDVFFFDEVHSLLRRKFVMDNLLSIMAQWRTLNGTPTPRVTFIAATTDADRLPEQFLGRFHIRPYFEPYSLEEMRDILTEMAGRMDVKLEPRVIHALARAAGGTPRTAATLIRNGRVLVDNDKEPTAENILQLSDMTPEGLSRLHSEYLKVIYKNPRNVRGMSVYRMGFTNICTIMHQPRETVERLERILIDKGYITLQPGGRELTDRGIREARK